MQKQVRKGRGRAVKDPKIIFTQVRIDEDTFLKGKILAAVYDESFNKLMVRAVQNEIRNYEADNGPLPEHRSPKQ